MVVGLNTSINIVGAVSFTGGGQASVIVGRKFDYVQGPSLAMTSPVKIARDNVSVSTSVAKFDRTSLSAKNVSGVISTEGKADLSKATAKIVSAEFCVFK